MEALLYTKVGERETEAGVAMDKVDGATSTLGSTVSRPMFAEGRLSAPRGGP
jgi:hypothetical protein